MSDEVEERQKVPVLPSAFLRKRCPKKALSKMFTYERDIICLPSSFHKPSGAIKIPRSPQIREYLSKNKLMGKIRLNSSMTEDNIFSEIRSVFSVPMRDDSLFYFKVLQPTGGTSKSLTIPSVSPTYKWTASAICGKNSKVPLYILAVDDLMVTVFVQCYGIPKTQ